MNLPRTRAHNVLPRFHRRNQPVAATWKGLNVLRLVGIIFQGFAQLVDGSVEPVVKVHKGVIRPKPAPEFLPRHYIAWVLQQHRQDFTRLFLQPDRESAPVEFPGLNIQFKGSDVDMGGSG